MTLNKSGRVIDLERLKNSLKDLDSPLFNRFEFEIIPKRELSFPLLFITDVNFFSINRETNKKKEVLND